MTEEEKDIKEYNTNNTEISQPPNVASSSVVMHLQVQQTDLLNEEESSYNYEREFLNYKPDVTLPWAYTENDSFSVSPQELLSNSVEIVKDSPVLSEDTTGKNNSVVAPQPNNQQTETEQPIVPEETTIHDENSYVKKVTSVLRDFERKNNDGEWQMSTSVSCYWCTFPFDNPPIGLPVKYFNTEDGFYVNGCFCSISCAAAYNLASRESNDTVCERHSMLCSLSRMLHGTDKIKVAPNWKSLQKFGGYMSIEQFRDFPQEKVLLCDVPPMRSLTVQLEEVNEGDVGSGYNYVPLDPVRVERGELSLKRKKPLHDFRNTLDHKMNVTIKTNTN
ncbi:hypothetical protein TetV_293 [Tetraselmis virus 1]|uniref:MYM-type domain-containing protein n=1 Tax=Tetraselmis virus 1 TaxID=2060617 RepID=A0A2P0VNA1_9VIRU|nr:hypothetical protein QJ968_gp293 [Tetraselmis virus 1]AUF82385.1 hypothetical protein TetV_293 [Tetraselmis virus 1]